MSYIMMLSWTSSDPRWSQLVSSSGVLYRFDTTSATNSGRITTLFRAARSGKEDQVAKLEWGPEGSPGRAIIGQNLVSINDLVRPVGPPFTRAFTGPDGYQYCWGPNSMSSEYRLEDFKGDVIAAYRPISPPQRSSIGEIHGELVFFPTASNGTILYPPLMDMVCVTAMLNRLLNVQNM